MKILISVFFGLLFVSAMFGQIAQISPGLCGKPLSGIPLPSNVSASVDRQQGQATVTLTLNGSPKEIQIPGVVEELKQVCPLPDSRLVIFGDAGNLSNINILDSKTGSLLDSFYGINPAMSPDQHWLAYQKFYPNHTELPVSEEYLIYDLTKGAAENRPPGVNIGDRDDVGSVVYPLGQKNLSGDNIGVPADQQHQTRSYSFAWSADSKAFAFEDDLENHLSVVLVTIDDKGHTHTYIHPVPLADVCPTVDKSTSDYVLTIVNTEVGQDSNGDRLIRVGFRPNYETCTPKTVEFYSDTFQPAATELHIPVKYKRKSVEGTKP